MPGKALCTVMADDALKHAEMNLGAPLPLQDKIDMFGRLVRFGLS